MFIRPCSVATAGAHHFKDGVYTKIVMRENWSASVVGVARKEVGVNATAAIDLSQIDINGLIQFNNRSNSPGAQVRSTCRAEDGIRCSRRRELPVITHVIPKSSGDRRAACNQSSQPGERVRGLRCGCIGIGLTMSA